MADSDADREVERLLRLDQPGFESISDLEMQAIHENLLKNGPAWRKERNERILRGEYRRKVTEA